MTATVAQYKSDINVSDNGCPPAQDNSSYVSNTDNKSLSSIIRQNQSTTFNPSLSSLSNRREFDNEELIALQVLGGSLGNFAR